MMRRSSLIVLIIVIIVLAGVAAAMVHKSRSNTSPSPTSNSQPKSSNNSASSNSQPATGTIDIKNMAFTPSQITVAKGGTVTWTNNDSVTHTVVDDLSNVGGPNSGDIAPGASYSFTFTKTGSYQYHCSIHPSMRGTIVVK
jgi:plastocyanin